MRAWSDPLKGGVVTSHERRVGKIFGLAMASSMALGQWVPVKRNQV